MTAELPPLYFGPYYPPPCRAGDWIDDEELGRIQVGRFSDGPISWPIRKGRGKGSLVMTADLVRAVRRESRRAIAAWFGVHFNTVQRWRRTFAVPPITEGTVRLTSASLSVAMTGLQHTPEHIAHVVAARRGRRISDAAVQRMSAGQRQRYQARRLSFALGVAWSAARLVEAGARREAVTLLRQAEPIDLSLCNAEDAALLAPIHDAVELEREDFTND